jgi:uncharacterized OB-fold protein
LPEDSQKIRDLRREIEMKESLREKIASLLPVITDFEKPFWDSLQNGQLMVQKCQKCGHVQFPPSPVCTDCLTKEVKWIPCSGKAILWSKVAFHKAYLEPYSDVPYHVAMAKLEEGPIVTGRISADAATALALDAQLRATYVKTADGTVLVEFVPEK